MIWSEDRAIYRWRLQCEDIKRKNEEDKRKKTQELNQKIKDIRQKYKAQCIKELKEKKIAQKAAYAELRRFNEVRRRSARAYLMRQSSFRGTRIQGR